MPEQNYHRCKGHPDVRHSDNQCNGQIAVGGEGWVKMPTGFGFKGKKFVVDAIKYPAYSGFCLKCGADGMFIRTDRKGKKVTHTPKQINRSIDKMRTTNA